MLMVLMLLRLETCQVTAAAPETQVIDNERPTRTGVHTLNKLFCVFNIEYSKRTRISCPAYTDGFTSHKT